MGAEHPELSIRKDHLLCLIALRLSALLGGMGIPDPAADITPLSLDYLEELYHFAEAKVEAVREAIRNPNG